MPSPAGWTTECTILVQRIQNMAARMIVGAKRSGHITPILKNLHWLLVKARIEYKILLLTFKTICGYSPKYVDDLIQLSRNSYNLRSSSYTNLLQQPRTRSKPVGRERFFSGSWNVGLLQNFSDYITTINKFTLE